MLALGMASKGIEVGALTQDDDLADLWLPKTKMRFLTLLSIAVISIYAIGEVRTAGVGALFAICSMLMLHFAEIKPHFEPFPWRALMFLPLAAAVSFIAGVQQQLRAALTATFFGVVLLGFACSGVLKSRRVQ